jgi:hypothetical protein
VKLNLKFKMHINVIGDIHGRKSWKALVSDDCVNVFVGDYFDPYEKISHEQLRENFLDIVAYKQAHPESILLIGNHDKHYILGIEESTRYDHHFAAEAQKMLTENADLMQAAAAFGDTLITHAGVSAIWYLLNAIFPEIRKLINANNEKFKDFKSVDEIAKFVQERNKDVDFQTIFILWRNRFWYFSNGKWQNSQVTPDELAAWINQQWKANPAIFDFCPYSDEMSGDSPLQGPMWIRPNSLLSSNIFSGTKFRQIVGHTQFEEILDTAQMESMKDLAPIVFVDCLDYKAEAYKFESGSL